MSVFDKSFDVLSKAMDLYMVRQSVLADNVANAETPGYKARRVDFEEALEQVIADSNTKDSPKQASREIASVLPQIYQEPNSEVGLDGNTVDMDREMAAIQKNDVKYSAASEMISRKFALLKYAISEGKD